MKKISIAAVLVVLTGLLIAADPPPSAIDATTARTLAIAQYNALFRGKYYLNPSNHQYHEFPQLGRRLFHTAELKDGCWVLEGDPPAGVRVHAKVSADGKWVQLTSVEYAPQ